VCPRPPSGSFDPSRQLLPGAWRSAHGRANRGAAMRNAELARVFRDIAAYLDMDDVPCKPRAYEQAAQAIESHDRPLDAVYRAGGVNALREIHGIGTAMAEKLEELSTTGNCKPRERDPRRTPVAL